MEGVMVVGARVVVMVGVKVEAVQGEAKVVDRVVVLAEGCTGTHLLNVGRIL
jgi:hypothetical protein